MAYEWSRCGGLLIGPVDSGSATSSPNIDSAFVFGTSGDAWFCRLPAPVGQSAATLTLYAFCTAVTGAPTFQIEVRNGYEGSGDVDRPETSGSNLASSPSTLTLGASDANTWVSLTCTVSLTQGDSYYVIIKNTHATPASNHATFQYRGSLDALIGGSSLWYAGFINAGYTSDGFATDPTINTAGMASPFVIKFSDGTLVGFPYVGSSAHASDTNSRGFRITPTEDMVVSGIGVASTTANLSGVGIYTAAGATVVTATGDPGVESKGAFYRFAPVTLSGGTSYDIVSTYASNNTAGTYYTMGEIEANVPADVLACRPPGFASVDGATPGSFTVNTSQVLGTMALLIDDMPAIAGGTGGVIGGPNMRGGMMA